MYRLRPNPNIIDPRYLESFLQSAPAQRAIDVMKTGISDCGLNLTHDRFRRLLVPVAPLPEQRRIVAEIETQLSRLDAGIAALTHVQANLKRYRAAVLRAACEGRLVPTEAELARQEGRDYEPADVLLKRILAERRARWEADQLAKMEAQGRLPLDDVWRVKYREPAVPDTTYLAELPKGWLWATAEQLSDETRSITYGVVKLGDHDNNGIPTLRSSNVRHLRLDLNGVKQIRPSLSADYKRTILKGGEILLTVRGTLGGIVCVPDSCAGYNISREVAMIAPVDTSVSRLITIFIGSSPTQNWLLRHTRGIAYTGINIDFSFR